MLSFGDLGAGVVCMPDAECNPATGWCRQLTYQEQLKKDPTGGTMEAGQRAQVMETIRRDPTWLARATSAPLDARASAAPAPQAAPAGAGLGVALGALAGYFLFLR
jgi:hypothetical protein